MNEESRERAVITRTSITDPIWLARIGAVVPLILMLTIALLSFVF